MKKIFCATAILVIVVAAVPASAGTMLGFSIGSGGVFEYAAGERVPRFYGGGIKVTDLTYGVNTLRILRGRLAFSSGTFLRSGGGNLFWGAGGSISMKGCADLNHDHKCGAGDYKGTLMTGKFLNTELIQKDGKEILKAEIVDQISPQLAALLHLSSTTYTGELELTLVQLRDGRWWVKNGVQGGFLNNQGTVPEPSSIWLLGAALACCVVVRLTTSVGTAKEA